MFRLTNVGFTVLVCLFKLVYFALLIVGCLNVGFLLVGFIMIECFGLLWVVIGFELFMLFDIA